MRLGNFESVGKKPLGSGIEKDVFVDPDNEEKVLSILKTLPGQRRNSPNKIKGSYYLTKIAHILLPKNVPDITQATISKDGKEIFDRQRIEHTKGHEMLQSARANQQDESEALKVMRDEIDPNDASFKLEDIGLGFHLDENMGNYTKDKEGNVYYLETFIPWGENIENEKELELFFDKEGLEDAINELPEQEKKICTSYYNRLLELFNEDKIVKEKEVKENIVEKMPTKEEIVAIVESVTGLRNPKITREESDENGLLILDIETLGDGPGEIKSYEYVRKVAYNEEIGHGASESRISITYYDERGIPFTGHNFAMYHPDKDEWQFFDHNNIEK